MPPFTLRTNRAACDSSISVAEGDSHESIIRVMVIENNDEDRKTLLRQLRKANVRDHILFVNEGGHALDLLSQIGDVGPPCELVAIFLDIKLRDGMGLEILKLVRSREALARVPIIVMTGSENQKDKDECKRLKVTSYIAKPIAFQSFCMAIANVFNLPLPSTWQNPIRSDVQRESFC